MPLCRPMLCPMPTASRCEAGEIRSPGRAVGSAHPPGNHHGRQSLPNDGEARDGTPPPRLTSRPLWSPMAHRAGWARPGTSGIPGGDESPSILNHWVELSGERKITRRVGRHAPAKAPAHVSHRQGPGRRNPSGAGNHWMTSGATRSVTVRLTQQRITTSTTASKELNRRRGEALVARPLAAGFPAGPESHCSRTQWRRGSRYSSPSRPR